MPYIISGTYVKNKENHNFAKKINANNANLAKESLYTLFGSKNKLKRRQIKIIEIKESE